MKRAIVLQHAAFEGPARLAPLLVERGFAIDVRRLDRGDPVPARIAPNDLLIVMGGPMGVGDKDRPEYSFLNHEIDLLKRCIKDDSPVLGVCLGAQLLAFAAGARVGPMTSDGGNPLCEVGWAPIQFHSSGATDSLLAGLPAEALVLHWHGDTFDLPNGARLFASTLQCSNQAFQLGARMFGLQFHCEVEESNVDDFLRADSSFVTRANGPNGVEELRRDTARHASPSWNVGQRLLRNILDAMTRAA
jgi:GMP synthase-like glutamine amidotransferase